MNIGINVNQDVLERLKKDNIPINLAGSVLLILMALYHDNYNFLEYIDKNNNNDKHLNLLYLLLYRKGYIVPTSEQDLEEALYKITDKGSNIVKYAEATSLQIITTENDSFDWIKDFNNLFPEPIRGERNLRGNEQSCIARMKWFMKQYAFSKEHILSATEEYINSQGASDSGHKYTQTSDYFIKKGTGADCTSRLAQACEQYDPNNLTPKQDHLRDVI